jgi:hypothetical protein
MLSTRSRGQPFRHHSGAVDAIHRPPVIPFHTDGMNRAAAPWERTMRMERLIILLTG